MSTENDRPDPSAASGDRKQIYGIWSQAGIVEQYVAKGKADFFASDTYFLSRISNEVRSILDVGCAAGGLIKLFEHFRYDAEYVGIDIAPENIKAARQLHPAHHFEVADAVTYNPGRRFDLVYCAGTMFHIPQYESVINNMLSWSDRYVGFEVKLGPVADAVRDIDRSYCQVGADRAFMIVLNLWKFMEWLTQQPGIGRIQLFGYRTPINKVTFTLPEIKHFVSCCVFIEKGDHLHEVSIDLPFASLR